MSLITCASGKSLWRGIDYYKNKKVITYDRISEEEYIGTVQGSGGAVYTTRINPAHPRKSKCSCPLADGKRIVCKHMLALYFTVFPDEVDEVYRQAQEAEEEADWYEEELAERVRLHVMHMKKQDLQEALLELLDYGPDWVYNHFVWKHDLE